MIWLLPLRGRNLKHRPKPDLTHTSVYEMIHLVSRPTFITLVQNDSGTASMLWQGLYLSACQRRLVNETEPRTGSMSSTHPGPLTRHSGRRASTWFVLDSSSKEAAEGH